jgi:hypothetical protein
MGLFQTIFRRKKTFAMQPSDVKMWQASRAANILPRCDCFNPCYEKSPFDELRLHADVQNEECDAWKLLESLIEKAIADSSKEFSPGLEMSPEMWSQITTLPSSISRLKSVRKLYLYSSHLVRIPAEIGGMENLEELDIYTSYRLHWLPYEVIRCQKLTRSRASTRALYGNYKYRPPFPRLGDDASRAASFSGNCSVCSRDCPPTSVRQVWISLLVAKDVLPLLVNACSDECIGRLPQPAYGYVDRPHKGGLDVKQPPAEFIRPHR